MLEHDQQVGQLLDKLRELGIEDNTIVIYSTDNGSERMLWPDGGYAPLRVTSAASSSPPGCGRRPPLAIVLGAVVLWGLLGTATMR